MERARATALDVPEHLLQRGIAVEPFRRRGAARGLRNAGVLGEKDDVSRYGPRVVEPRLRADRVEARALLVSSRRVIAQRRLLGAAAGGEHIQKVVLEEEHVIGT